MDFTLVYMIAYITTSISIGTSQSKLPLFLREKLCRFWSIRQENYGDETYENRRNALTKVLKLAITGISHMEKPDLDNEKQAPGFDRSVNVLYPKGNETTKCASDGCESEPVPKA